MLVSRRSSVDPFIVMDVMEAARQAEAGGRHIIHMEVGQPGTGAPKAAIEAVRKTMSQEALGYTVALGLPELRARIARLYADWYGVDLDPARVVVTSGSSAGFILAFTALFGVLSALSMGGNARGAWLAGAVPHRGPGGAGVPAGKDVAAMLESPLKAYLLWGIEPGFEHAALGRHGREPLVVHLHRHPDNASELTCLGLGSAGRRTPGAVERQREPHDHHLGLLGIGQGAPPGPGQAAQHNLGVHQVFGAAQVYDAHGTGLAVLGHGVPQGRPQSESRPIALICRER